MKDYWRKNWFFLVWAPVVLFVGYLFRTDDSPYWFPWTVTVILGLACMAWYWQGPPKEGNDTSKEGNDTSKDRVLALKTRKEFLQKEYEKGEEILAKWRKDPHYTNFVEDGVKHQKETLTEIRNTEKEIEMLDKESPTSKSPTPWRTTLNVGSLLFLEVLVAASILSLWDPVNRNLGMPTKDTITREVTDTVTYRASCDSTILVINQNEVVDNRTITRKWDFTTDTLIGTTKVTKSSDTVWSYNPLTIDSLRCGDTITIAKRSIPYEDRNISLARIFRKYIQKGSWTVKEEVIYRNKSSSIDDWDLNKIFSGKRAWWTHTVTNTKYALSLLHENKIDTLDSKDDAQSLLEAKCKDAATKKNEFSYAEFNACKSNGTIAKVRIPQEEFCGKAQARLLYNRGPVSQQPYGCWGTNPSWRYEE